jgi:hypothetical protein
MELVTLTPLTFQRRLWPARFWPAARMQASRCGLSAANKRKSKCAAMMAMAPAASNIVVKPDAKLWRETSSIVACSGLATCATTPSTSPAMIRDTMKWVSRPLAPGRDATEEA